MTTARIEPQPAPSLTASPTSSAIPAPAPSESSALTSSVVPLASAISSAQAVEAVALHVAATALSPTASLSERERVRSQWASHLVALDLAEHPFWHAVYLPGMTFNDGETWAVHRTSGRVAGGDCPTTRQHDGESTQEWLDRLS